MKSSQAAPRRAAGARIRSALLAAVLAVPVALAAALPARADDYDSSRAGHPLRVVAYVVHPVGVILDTILFRPAHWLVSKEPLRTLFGHHEE